MAITINVHSRPLRYLSFIPPIVTKPFKRWDLAHKNRFPKTTCTALVPWDGVNHVIGNTLSINIIRLTQYFRIFIPLTTLIEEVITGLILGL